MKMLTWVLNSFKELGPAQREKGRVLWGTVVSSGSVGQLPALFTKLLFSSFHNCSGHRATSQKRTGTSLSSFLPLSRVLRMSLQVQPLSSHKKNTCDLSLLLQAQCPLSESNFPELWMSAFDCSGAFSHQKLSVLLLQHVKIDYLSFPCRGWSCLVSRAPSNPWQFCPSHQKVFSELRFVLLENGS